MIINKKKGFNKEWFDNILNEYKLEVGNYDNESRAYYRVKGSVDVDVVRIFFYRSYDGVLKYSKNEETDELIKRLGGSPDDESLVRYMAKRICEKLEVPEPVLHKTLDKVLNSTKPKK